MEKISVIVPCLNEQEVLPLFYKETKKVLEEMKNVCFEYIFIDDGSCDNTLILLKELSLKDPSLHFLSFSRNFGKEAAMYAGLKRATGKYSVIIDADLQHPPHLIKEMYRILKEEGYDSVATRRVNRVGEPKIRSFFAHLFYKFMRKMSKIEVVDGEMDFRMMSKKMVESILSMEEYNRFSKGIFSFVGFRTKWIEQENVKRVAGNTKWSFFKLLQYSLEGIVSFSTKPLLWVSFLGFLLCLVSAGMGIYIVIQSFILKNVVSSLCFFSFLFLMISGMQLFGLGILSFYFSKMYLETKKRPLYIVKETDEDA